MKKTFKIACLATGMLCWAGGFEASVAWADLGAGAQALQQGHYAQALQELAQAAKAGDAEAAYLYGTMLKDGLGLPAADASAAVHWYARAAEAGHADAQLNLGFMAFHGIGMPKDPQLGFHWYEKAAQAGLPAAQYNLGKVLWDSQSSNQRDLAQSWFLKSAEQGMAEAQFALAVAYLAHDPAQFTQAVKWFQRAAAQGEPRAYTKLAGLYTLGQGVEKDLVQAAKWAVLAEGAGDPMGRNLRIQLNSELSVAQKQQAMALARNFQPKPE